MSIKWIDNNNDMSPFEGSPSQEGEIFNEPQLAAWDISENNFPAKGSNSEKLKFMLHYADRTRALPMVDPDDRAVIISCGAAPYHLQLAMHYFGYIDRVEFFPKQDNTDLIARITSIGA